MVFDLDNTSSLKLIADQLYNKAQMDLRNNEDILASMDSIKELAYSLRSNQALQASALVGRKILFPSNTFKLNSEGVSLIYIEKPLEIRRLMILIYSERDLIRKILLEQEGMGLIEFNWDGLNQQGKMMSLGQYTLLVKGFDEKKEVILKTVITANIDSVCCRDDGVILVVEGVGEVALA